MVINIFNEEDNNMRKYKATHFLRNNFMKLLNISKYTIIILFVVLYVTFISVQNGFSTTYYVDNAASGTNDGSSWANAWQSFAAIRWGSITAGDTIYISGGATSKTYNEQLTVGTSGTSGNPVTIAVGQDTGHNGLVIIDGQTTVTYCINTASKSYVTITGELNGTINLKCVNTYSQGVLLMNPTGIKISYIEIDNAGVINNAHGVAFANIVGTGNELSYSSIHGAYQDGVSIGTGPVNTYGIVAIHHNHIYDISDDGIQGGSGLDIYNNTIGGLHIPPKGSGHPDGIQAMGGYERIYNNLFTETGHANVFVDPIGVSGQIVENIYVYNNTFEGGTNNNAIVIGGDTPNPPNGLNNVYVLNNTIVDTGGVAIDIGPGKIGSTGTLTNARVLNNIVYNSFRNNQFASVILAGPGNYSTSDLVIDYNTVHEGNSGTSIISWKGTAYSYDNFVSTGLGQAHGKHVKPAFVAYTEGTTGNNLRLSSKDISSINVGVNLASFFNTDKDGVSRPKGPAWDVGAYENIDNIAPNPPLLHP